jgi:hypothetical protein
MELSLFPNNTGCQLRPIVYPNINGSNFRTFAIDLCPATACVLTTISYILPAQVPFGPGL